MYYVSIFEAVVPPGQNFGYLTMDVVHKQLYETTGMSIVVVTSLTVPTLCDIMMSE